ncbi:MAG: response regulator [Melioribacteraceae bacterium]
MSVKKKILIIEDDSLLQEFYKVLFRKLDREIIILEDANMIISEILNGDICLIIMDINLKNTYLREKRTDGIKLSHYIKVKYSNLNIPIILITAYSSNYISNDILQESLADDILLKPIVDFDLLVDKINKLLEKR